MATFLAGFGAVAFAPLANVFAFIVWPFMGFWSLLTQSLLTHTLLAVIPSNKLGAGRLGLQFEGLSCVDDFAGRSSRAAWEAYDNAGLEPLTVAAMQIDLQIG